MVLCGTWCTVFAPILYKPGWTRIGVTANVVCLCRCTLQRLRYQAMPPVTTEQEGNLSTQCWERHTSATGQIKDSALQQSKYDYVQANYIHGLFTLYTLTYFSLGSVTSLCFSLFRSAITPQYLHAMLSRKTSSSGKVQSVISRYVKVKDGFVGSALKMTLMFVWRIQMWGGKTSSGGSPWRLFRSAPLM